MVRITGKPRKQYCDLAVVLAVSVAAILCGCQVLYAIAQWSRDHRRKMCSALGIERGTTPCVATLHRVFKDLDVDAFERVLGDWLAHRFVRPAGVAIDDQALRGIHGEGIWRVSGGGVPIRAGSFWRDRRR